MLRRNGLARWLIMAAVICFCTCVLWSQESPAAEEKTNLNSELQWLWGEVELVNVQAKTMQVKYLDYDTDIEKELVLTVDGKTKYENAKGLDDIKPQDTVSVDYMSGSDGINLAVAVSLEKLEDMEPAPEEFPVQERVGSAPTNAVNMPAEPAVSEQPVVPVAQAEEPAVPAEDKQ